MLSILFSVIFLFACQLTSAQQLAQDPTVRGPPLELVHLYYDEWPTGTKPGYLRCRLMPTLLIVWHRNRSVFDWPEVLQLSTWSRPDGHKLHSGRVDKQHHRDPIPFEGDEHTSRRLLQLLNVSSGMCVESSKSIVAC